MIHLPSLKGVWPRDENLCAMDYHLCAQVINIARKSATSEMVRTDPVILFPNVVLTFHRSNPLSMSIFFFHKVKELKETDSTSL